MDFEWIWTLINYNMKILQVAFLLLFNYLDSLPKLYFRIVFFLLQQSRYIW